MEKKLYRNPNDRVLGGVASGLGRYFEIDVTWVRILFILAAIFGFSGVFIYIIFWIAIPDQPFSWNSNAATDYRVNENATSADPASVMPDPTAPKNTNSRLVSGLVLIFLGLFFLLNEFDLIPYWFNMGKLWPLVFIIPGLILISNSVKNGRSKDKTEESKDPDNNSSIH